MINSIYHFPIKTVFLAAFFCFFVFAEFATAPAQTRGAIVDTSSVRKETESAAAVVDSISSIEESSRIKIMCVGDLMTHETQIVNAYDASTDTYNFSDCFKFVRPIISEADIAVANFETVLGGKPYEGYPAFSAPDQFAEAVKYAGFDMLGFANNHVADRGGKGIDRTLGILDSLGFVTTGAFLDSADKAARNVAIVERDGIKFSLVNFTYGTNGRAVAAPRIVNRIDRDDIAAALAAARDSSADFVVAFFHWGSEYERYPGASQKNLADFCFENGADMVIGSHPHVLQPAEKKTIVYQGREKEVFVVYSLGNFISNQRKRYRDGGAIFEFDLVKEFVSGETTFENVKFTPTWVYPAVIGSKREFYIFPAYLIESNEGPVKISSWYFEKFKTYLSDTRSHFPNPDAGFIERSYPDYVDLPERDAGVPEPEPGSLFKTETKDTNDEPNLEK